MSLGELEKGLDSVIGNSEGQGETVSSGAVHGPFPLLLNGLFPEILKNLRRYLLHEPFLWPCTPWLFICHKSLCFFLALYHGSCSSLE